MEFNIDEALLYLSEGKTIKTISNNYMNYFRLVDGNIRVNNKNTKYFLSLEEFKTLYIKNLFLLHESKIEEGIDSKKDEEYYSWSHK